MTGVQTCALPIYLNERNPPTERGFDEFFGMLGGYNSCWQEEPFYTRWPQGRVKRAVAPGKFYSTDVFADYAIEFIGDGKSGQPWFQYLAFNAPHFPLHAPETDIAKYEAMYFAKGWDRIREERLARQKELGVIPREAVLTPRANVPANRFNKETGWADKDNPAWDSVPENRRRDLARRMAVYAAMVDRLDAAVGRVVAHLKATAQFENTVIFFLSDHGACAEWDPWGFDKSSSATNVLHTGDDLKTVGGPESYISYGSGWANVCNTPFKLYKHYSHEGGVRTPFIVHWPAGLKARGLVPGLGYITDFMPTICELTGATYPTERNGAAILPQEGMSLVPALRGEPLATRRIFIEHEGNRSVRDGEWKLVAIEGKPWELYRIGSDPTEMHDLAAQELARVKELAAAWEDWAERCDVKERRVAKTDTPQIANKPLNISCDVETRATDGVILAHGGRQNGYALWLKGGKPIFTVRIAGKATDATANETLSGKFKLTARLATDGAMTLSLNAHEAATARAPGVISTEPKDGLSIGEDTLTAVGDYAAPHPLKGSVTNVQITTE